MNMKLMREVVFATALTLGSLASSVSAYAHEVKAGNLVIHHPWARQAPASADVMAGFMKIINTGTVDDRLVSVTAAIANVVQLHDMKMEGDVMKMFEVPGGIVIPAGQTVELKPKSLHLMFIGLKSEPMEGEEIKGQLMFEKAGLVDVEFEVTAPGGEAHH